MKKIMITAIAVLSFIACEQETCPEGSTEIRDAQGNFLNCFTPPKWNKSKLLNETIGPQVRTFRLDKDKK